MEEQRKGKEDHTWWEEPCGSFREEMEKKIERNRKKIKIRGVNMGKCKLTSVCGSKQCCIECPHNDVCNMQCIDVDEYEYCVECPEYERE